MARIRTIKPDFWTDERLTECSLSARLLFIGTWNFADDNGNLPRSAKKLKMQIFPADSFDCEPLIQELITHGVLIEYSVNNENYLHIKNFKKHQIVNRPSKSSIPQPKFIEDSLSHQGVLTDGKEEEKEKEKENTKTTSPKKFADDDFMVAEFFWQRILALNPAHKKPNLDSWAVDIRLMRERDNRTVEDIRDLFSWANAHGFWRGNILSPKKLREKWDVLVIQKSQRIDNGQHRRDREDIDNSAPERVRRAGEKWLLDREQARAREVAGERVE